jgi:hypothetical protein
MHKTPYKFRFIAGARKSSAKQLSVILLNALKTVRTHFQNYCNVIKQKTGRSMCWSINNNTSLLEYLKENNNQTENLLTYDFSTLFTGLPHDVIITNMFEIINKMFLNSKKTFMHISKDANFGATFYTDTDKCKSTHLAVRCTEILDILQFVVTESYVKFAGIIFKQIKGIPMGGNASSLIADLTLSMIEFRYLKSLNNITAHAITFRYVDDLARIDKALPAGIYPPELKLTAEVPNLQGEINYLDLCYSIPNNSVKLYNKTDNFNFNVISSMNYTSAISDNTIKGIIISQLMRFARISTNFDDYMVCVNNLYRNYLNNGHQEHKLKSTITDYCKHYTPTLHQYNIYCIKKARLKITNKII